MYIHIYIYIYIYDINSNIAVGAARRPDGDPHRVIWPPFGPSIIIILLLLLLLLLAYYSLYDFALFVRATLLWPPVASARPGPPPVRAPGVDTYIYIYIYKLINKHLITSLSYLSFSLYLYRSLTNICIGRLARRRRRGAPRGAARRASDSVLMLVVILVVLQ